MKVKSLEEFSRMAEREEGVGFRSPLGLLAIQKEGDAWVVHDLGSAPDDVVGHFDTLDDLLVNFKRKGKCLKDIWHDLEVILTVRIDG